MKLIQNENMAFRLPNTLKEKLVAYADENELHVAAVVRSACSAFLKQKESDRLRERNFREADYEKSRVYRAYASEDGLRS